MGDADSSQEPVKTLREISREKRQKRSNRVRIYGAVGWLVGSIAIFIVVPVYFSTHSSTPDWVGMDKSDEKSQVSTEEVKGNITKTTTTTKFESAKTLWDWMSLLLAPATLAGLGFMFQASQEQAKVAREERSEEQAQAEKERDEDRQRDDAIEAYINSISDLWVGKSLSILVKQKTAGMLDIQQQDLLDAYMNVIRARTLSIFRRFTDYQDSKRTDGGRKGSILLFLYETGLISIQKEYEQEQEQEDALRMLLEEYKQEQEDAKPKQFQALLSLKDADLTHANLIQANLRGANLKGINLSSAYLCLADLRGACLFNAYLMSANLTYADLRGAYLAGARLDEANFSRVNLGGAFLFATVLNSANLSQSDLSDAFFWLADLIGSDLSHANLRGADLSDANLSGAILFDVDLSQTKYLTQEQLEVEEPPLLCKVKLPKNIKVDPNRDCKNIPKVLLERYPEQFENLEEAQECVDKQTIPL